MGLRSSKPAVWFILSGIVSKHKTCWHCVNMRVHGFPMRSCKAIPQQYVWSDPETEIRETGKTIADNCLYYTEDVFNQLMVRHIKV
jgi:hypothetical protein